MTVDVADRIQLVEGDITTLHVDAVVTAANEALVGGHGVDGAVHRAAGPALFAECQSIGICPEGEARITKGYLLPATHIIHTVGPVWEGGEYGEAKLLESCYVRSLELAAENNITTIAFPCIATGAHEYPQEQASEIAVATVARWLANHESPKHVTFCCYDERDVAVYRETLRQAGVDC